MIIGRIAWDLQGEYWTPWMEFRNLTEFRKWCTAMRKAMGKPGPNKLKSEYIYLTRFWTPDSLLKKVQKVSELIKYPDE